MKILYISYFYPPLGGPAALRNVKTVKYLTELGCEIDVISVGDIEYNYHDDSLLEECKQHRLIRTTSYDPMAVMKKVLGKRKQASQALYRKTPERIKLLVRRLYPLDDKVGWLPPLYKAGAQALMDTKYDLIYVSCGPFSSSLAAYWLSRRFKVPYAVEMRDYWTLLSDYNLQGSWLHRAFAKCWEKRILHAAKFIITATKGIAEDLAQAFGKELSAKMQVLYNGHDKEDYEGIALVQRDDAAFVISYFGALYARRSLKGFFAAVKQAQEEGSLQRSIMIKLYGNYHVETEREIAESGINGQISIIPALSHREALQEMAASDALLLVINSSSPRGTLTSKVFEYLRIGKPILALAPQHGEVAELLHESGQDFICAMESVSAIKECLIRIQKPRSHAFSYNQAKYMRRAQVLELYKFLQSL